jgi:octaprenyl-diphosphate synthase
VDQLKLEEILRPISGELAAVESRLSSSADACLPIVPEAIRHVARSGGKRLRPACVLFAAELGPAPQADRVELAAAVEIVHTASLIHDDMVDRAPLRRGRATLHEIWGEGPALLIGDLLYSKLFRDLCAPGREKVLSAVAEAVHRMVLGELAETIRRDDLSLGEEEFLEIVGNKTASLFACAGYLGAWAGGLPEDECARLRAFGAAFGTAFQLVDDLQDLCEEEETLGKPVGADLRDGKPTLPVIHAVALDRKRGRARVEELFMERDGPALVAAAREYGSLDYALGRAEERLSEAGRCLEALPDGLGRRGLAGLVAYVAARGRAAIDAGAENGREKAVASGAALVD